MKEERYYHDGRAGQYLTTQTNVGGSAMTEQEICELFGYRPKHSSGRSRLKAILNI